jgi:hypothetical protein
MQIRKLEQALRPGYTALLREQPDALVYQSLPYQDLLCEMLGASNETAVVCDGGGNVRGALPILAREGKWGPVYNSLPFYGSNGGIVADGAEAREALVGWYNALAQDPAIASCTLITNPLADDAANAGIARNRADSRIGQLSPIDAGTEPSRLMEGFHYKTRNMIRKAEKCGVEVSMDNDAVAFLKDTHYENLAALGGTPKPRSFFDLFPRHFHAGSEYRIYTARAGGQAVAALLLFYFNKTVEYFMPVIRKEYRDQQPMSLLAYTAMCDAARDGYAWWNWGGTWHSQEGVYRFKSRWGTQDRPYAYHVQLNRVELEQRDKREILDAYPFFYVLPFATTVAN